MAIEAVDERRVQVRLAEDLPGERWQHDVGIHVDGPAVEAEAGEAIVDACAFAELAFAGLQTVRGDAFDVPVFAETAGGFVFVGGNDDHLVEEEAIVGQGFREEIVVAIADDDGFDEHRDDFFPGRLWGGARLISGSRVAAGFGWTGQVLGKEVEIR